MTRLVIEFVTKYKDEWSTFTKEFYDLTEKEIEVLENNGVILKNGQKLYLEDEK